MVPTIDLVVRASVRAWDDGRCLPDRDDLEAAVARRVGTMTADLRLDPDAAGPAMRTLQQQGPAALDEAVLEDLRQRGFLVRGDPGPEGVRISLLGRLALARFAEDHLDEVLQG
jgi:hypothetical protein